MVRGDPALDDQPFAELDLFGKWWIASIYIYTYIYHIHIYIYIYIYTYIFMYIYTHTYSYIYTYIHIYIHTHVYIICNISVDLRLCVILPGLLLARCHCTKEKEEDKHVFFNYYFANENVFDWWKNTFKDCNIVHLNWQERWTVIRPNQVPSPSGDRFCLILQLDHMFSSIIHKYIETLISRDSFCQPMIQCATWSGGESVEASPTSNAGGTVKLLGDDFGGLCYNHIMDRYEDSWTFSI